jgi:DnaJ family protein C protein 3
MTPRRSRFSLATALLLAAPLSHCLDPSSIPSDTPISSIIASAKASLAQGNANEALEYYGIAINKDPQNYLTIFQRGATYLSLGRNGPASDDFNKVLSIKPGFEGALVQRAKIRGRNADWDGAKEDYREAGRGESQDFTDLVEAEGAAAAASNAEATKDWELCVNQAGTAIMVAGTALELRKTRAHCRFERGEVQEGVSDLQHVLHISPKSLEPYPRISATLFYSLNDIEKGLGQAKQCLRSDQDYKPCKSLHKGEKRIEKELKKLAQLRGKRKYNDAVKIIVGEKGETGLIDDVKDGVKEAKEAGWIHEKSPNELYNSLVDSACEFYYEVRHSLAPSVR